MVDEENERNAADVMLDVMRQAALDHVSNASECERPAFTTWSQNGYAMIDGCIYRHASKYANVDTYDSETGHFTATVISENRYLNGQKITGSVLPTKKND